MTRDLAHIPVRDLPAGYARLDGTRYATVAELRRGVKRREYHPATPLYQRPNGSVYIVVRRRKAPAPAWRRPAAIGVAVLSGVAAAGWGAYLAVMATVGAVRAAAPALAGIAGVAALLLAVAALRGGGGRIVEGTFRARIR